MVWIMYLIKRKHTKGLVIINYGVLYIYEFVFLVLGYLVYQKYYAYFELLYLERVIFVIKKIIHPFVFFLKKINYFEWSLTTSRDLVLSL